MKILIRLLSAAVALWVYVSRRRRRHAGAWMPPEARERLQRELRRPPRVQLAAQVEIKTRERTVRGLSQNVAMGGMLLEADGQLSVAEPVQVAFTLPDGPQISIPGAVCRRQGKYTAIKFDAADRQRFQIEQWIEARVVSR